MKTSTGDYLPFNEGGLPNANGNPFLNAGDLFLAGDVRANETVALTSMHTVFVREHNRLVDVLKARYPQMDSEALYQNAKAIVEAEMQAITYNEFLPRLIGEDALDAYEGYDPAVDPQIANEFATAAYRIGHSMLNATIARMEENGDGAVTGDLDLRESFFNPGEILANGIDSLLRGQAATTSQDIDHLVVDDVRNFLFGAPGEGGLDLVSLNIQRGRDHGVEDFNDVREAYGLQAYTDFDQVTSDPVLTAKLETLYGDVDNIDLFVGGLVEDQAAGALVGETFQAIIAHQFNALRSGDRYWYEGRFGEEIVEDLNSLTLSDIIARNTDIDYMQADAFIASDRLGGTAQADVINGGTENDLIIGFEGADLLYGHDGDDTLYGGADDDELYGGDGDDYLSGEEGTNTLYGEGGDDVLVYNEGDHYDGGDGVDTLYFKDGAHAHWDVAALNIEEGIEVLDFNNGQTDTVYLDIADILSLNDDSVLFIQGDDGQDRVLAPDFAGHRGHGKGATELVEHDGVEYALYTQGETLLYVESGLLGPGGGGHELAQAPDDFSGMIV